MSQEIIIYLDQLEAIDLAADLTELDGINIQIVTEADTKERGVYRSNDDERPQYNAEFWNATVVVITIAGGLVSIVELSRVVWSFFAKLTKKTKANETKPIINITINNYFIEVGKCKSPEELAKKLEDASSRVIDAD